MFYGDKLFQYESKLVLMMKGSSIKLFVEGTMHSRPTWYGQYVKWLDLETFLNPDSIFFLHFNI